MDSFESSLEENTEPEIISEKQALNRNLIFANLLSEKPYLLQKNVKNKEKRKQEIAEFLAHYETLRGEKLEPKQFIKKLYNMKSIVKEKSDRKKTGNKPIILLEWERKFSDVMNANENPVFSRVPGAASAATLKPAPAPIAL